MNRTHQNIHYASNWKTVRNCLEKAAVKIENEALRTLVYYVIREAAINTIDSASDYPKRVAEGIATDEVSAAKSCFLGSCGVLLTGGLESDRVTRNKCVRWFKTRGISG